MHILRKMQPRIRRAPGVPVVVSRRDEYGDAHPRKRGEERLACFGIGAAAVQKISGKKQNVRSTPLGLGGDALEQRALLAAADRRLLRAECFKR